MAATASREVVGSHSVTHLCFHGVGVTSRPTDADEDHYWVDRELFLRVLDLVVGRDDVRLSVDDGFDSDTSVVLPALQERGLRAMFFPVAGRLGELGSVTQDQVRELVAADMGIGVHGYTHQVWRSVSNPELAEELDHSRQTLHELTGRPVLAAACPLGSYDRRVLSVLKAQGFTTVYTSDRAYADDRAWLQPRYSLHRDDTVEELGEVLDRARSWRRDLRDRVRLAAKRLR